MIRVRLLAALLCVASLSLAHKVRVDFDHSTSFGAYKTYCLKGFANKNSPLPAFPNQLIQDRIAGYIEEALAARGLKRASTAEDLRVSYRIDVREQPQYITYGDGWGPGWGWDGWGYGWGAGSGFSTTTVQMTYEGTLVVDMVDVKRNKLVFEGTSAQSISSRPEKNSKKLAKAVAEVFEKYPPRP